ncbi:hypothetical protein ACPOL_4989 [Acidisarcina polymorpha]|uniref:Uncharacterized protein n=1 Tax=Acidisarcina polymorpha TaxID=2211140 RepID=A0A2Z5G595_9BACT|nr:hypothetical protein ACPOL_4989 [Acidisarcina polymorpha]
MAEFADGILGWRLPGDPDMLRFSRDAFAESALAAGSS